MPPDAFEPPREVDETLVARHHRNRQLHLVASVGFFGSILLSGALVGASMVVPALISNDKFFS